ncbi:hypothetical protein CK203_036731 [Vitis vinifera]|uniref:DUF4283 domain-containing protein n=1 Tax=Vitis vinifera TaxID=29760 RepID=A0A438I0R2_VITVI|nr:hypothetical protein CK203_036731 [Vitis vinifera]
MCIKEHGFKRRKEHINSPNSSFCLGGRASSCSSLFGLERALFVTVGEPDDGVGACILEKESLNPLREVWVDGRELGGSCLLVLELGLGEAVPRILVVKKMGDGFLEDLVRPLDCWSSSCFAKFSHYLGMLTKGFEWEILKLLKKMKERKDKKGIGTGNQDSRMSMGLVCSLGVGRFLEWEAVNLRGTVGGIMVFWANRVLQLVGLEVDDFNMIRFPQGCSSGGRLISTMRRFSEKFNLKKWNKEVFRQTAVGKAMALDQVVFWDTNERSCNLSHEEVEAREVVREEFKKLVMLKEISWRRNFSAKIKIHGTWLLEEKDIKEGVVQAFQALLTNSGDWRPSLNGLLFEGLEA